MAILFLAKAVELLADVDYNLAGQQTPAAGLILYGVLGVAGLWLSRRTGFLAVLSLRFGFYFVWHVVWPLL